MADKWPWSVYAPGAAVQAVRGEAAATVDDAAARRRRRPPNPAEQARRVAWGKTWGALNAEYARTLREDGT